MSDWSRLVLRIEKGCELSKQEKTLRAARKTFYVQGSMKFAPFFYESNSVRPTDFPFS